jgi:hypothetical protein
MKSLLAFLPLMIGCVQATASDDLTVSKSFSFPGSPVGADLTATVSDTTSVDVSSAMSSLSKVGTVGLSVSSSTLSGDDLSFLQHVNLTMQPVDGSMPVATVVDADVSVPDGGMADLPVSLDDATLVKYLSEDGGVNLTLSITGTIPTGDPALTWTLDCNASVSVNKSLSQIGN